MTTVTDIKSKTSTHRVLDLPPLQVFGTPILRVVGDTTFPLDGGAAYSLPYQWVYGGKEDPA